MSTVIFFEKPGCTGNARQIALLQAAGHQVIVKDLLSYKFTKDELRSYFGSLPVRDWFNISSPKIKSGEINPSSFAEDAALELMLTEPLFIRRPLMEIDSLKHAGFDIDRLEAAGINCKQNPRFKLLDGQDLDRCPGDQMGIKCDSPRGDPSL
jgi:nitrogenase-associated protein